MKHQCPKCSRMLYNRRLTCCGYCGAVIPEELRFTAEEIAELDREVAEMDAARAAKEALEDVARKIAKAQKPMVFPVFTSLYQ